MLLETIPYENNFPIEITTCNIREYPVHYHNDLEVVFLLRGNAILKRGTTTRTLSEGDVFTVPPRYVHGIRGMNADSVFAVLHINGDYLASHFPDALPWTYNTLLENRQDTDLGWLREQVLQLIIAYFQKNDGYQEVCTSLCHRIITLIDHRFGTRSINAETSAKLDQIDDQVICRLLRIGRFIQEHIYGPVSLSELAEQENLSTFYLSHLIKESTGMSFRDIVSYLRVIYSEAALLEEDKKISRIAKSCGFSTSKYYEQAFQRWFHHSPAEHVNTYRHMRLDITNLPQLDFLPLDELMDTISQVAFQVISQNRLATSAFSTTALLRYDQHTQTIKRLHCQPTISLTASDVEAMGALAGDVLEGLLCSNVILYQEPGDDQELIEQYTATLTNIGINVRIESQSFVPLEHRYGYDTLAGPMSLLLTQIFKGDGKITLPLRDRAQGEAPLAGGNGLYTPHNLHKPMYDTLFIIATSPGALKLRGSHYVLIELEDTPGGLLIIAFNYNDEILGLCQQETTPQSTRDTIWDFREELNLRFRLALPPKQYSIVRFTYTHHSSLFHYFSKLNFSPMNSPKLRLGNNYLFSPHAEGKLVDVNNVLDIDVTLRGLAMQFIWIQPRG